MDTYDIIVVGAGPAGENAAGRVADGGRVPGARSAVTSGTGPLTHMGRYRRRIAGDVIVGTDIRDVASRDVVPRVTLTDPRAAAPAGEVWLRLLEEYGL
jgi:pyruvate/2-oxoglutarate dehydrogenase complex dihydrolipoamide dehydrogenase (E3) component